MDPEPPGIVNSQRDSGPPALRKAWHSIRRRVLSGFLLVLPILITLWVIHWLYMTMEKYVIDPLALLVLWKVRGAQPDTELPFWFETDAALLIGILLALVLLYGLGDFANSRLRRCCELGWLR